jgi:HK97 family phage major capsid protein
MDTRQEIIKYFNEQNLGSRVAKAHRLTHTLSQMGGVSIDSVIKAMDTQEVGAGKEWIMTGFSPDVVQRVAQIKQVTGAIRRITMPANPYKLPVQGGPATAYITPENTADSGQTSVKFSNAGTAEVIFNAKKISAAVRVSDELDQDAIADTTALVNESILEGLAIAEENTLINGDTAGSHMDTDVTGSDDARKAVDGLRKRTQSSAKVDYADATNLTEAVRAARQGMGRYGYRPSEVALVASLPAYYKLLNEGTVITLDKYGPAATILTGELGKFDGMPILVSEFVRTDLNASGVYQSGATNTQILLFNRNSYAIGDRLNVELEPAREAIYGQDVLIGRERIDFQAYFAATEPAVSMIYNIPTV